MKRRTFTRAGLSLLGLLAAGCAAPTQLLAHSERPLWTENNPDDEALAAATELLERAVARRDAIRTSPTAIAKGDTLVPGQTYTGQAYYVSPGGNDRNSGRSPETPWATLGQVNCADLRAGDAVFFERGGIWRDTTVQTKPGVTYSAYGEGAKPRIVASPENGGDPACWSLWWQGPGGEKIWVYHRDMPDCGAIVLNEDRVANKVLGYWNGKEFLHYLGEEAQMEGRFTLEAQLAQPVFEVCSELSEDLTFFSRADSTLPDTLPAFLTGWMAEGEPPVGALYFRCDAGNPGQLYESIEFQTQRPLFDSIADGCVLDNLFVGFAGDGVLTVGEGRNVTVQNCEMGWVGGVIGAYNTDEEITGYGAGIQRLAGALGGGLENTRYLNNYVHGLYHNCGGLEIFEEQGDNLGSVTGTQFVGNLFCHCSFGLNFFNWDTEPNPDHQFIDCRIEDNYILFTGTEPWMDPSFAAAFVHQGGPNLQQGCTVRNNLFFVARSATVYISTYVKEYFPLFEGNTYVQYEGVPLIHSDSPNLEMDIFDEARAAEVLGDTSARFITLKETIWDNRLP